MNKSLLFWLAVLLFFAGGMAVWAAWKMNQRWDAIVVGHTESISEPVPSSMPGSDEPILTQFTLTERSGKPFGTDDLDGHVHVVSFFFASCPSSCRQQNERRRVQGIADQWFRITTGDCRHAKQHQQPMRPYDPKISAKLRPKRVANPGQQSRSPELPA